MAKETGETQAWVEVVGIGDQGILALDALMEDGRSEMGVLSLQVEERALRSKKAPTMLFRRGEWTEASRIWSLPLTWEERREQLKHWPHVEAFTGYAIEELMSQFVFVLADLGDRETEDMLAGVTGCSGYPSDVDAFTVAVLPQQQGTTTEEADSCLRALCRSDRKYPVVVMEMMPGEAEDTAARKAMAWRQSRFVRDIVQCDEAAIAWAEFTAFFQHTGAWKAWSAEGETLAAAMDEAVERLSRGGVLSAAQKVFVLMTGRAEAWSIEELQAGTQRLQAVLHGDAEMLLATDSEVACDSVRVHVAAQWGDGQ